MAAAMEPSTPVQSPRTSSLTLPDITRETIDIGLIDIGGDVGAHISQEDIQQVQIIEMPVLSYLEDYADGRVIGVVRLESGWDGTFEIGSDGLTVIKKTKKPTAFYNAQTILKRHGLDSNNIHVVTLQAAMDKKRKIDLKGAGTKNMHSSVYDEEILWTLPFQVR